MKGIRALASYKCLGALQSKAISTQRFYHCDDPARYGDGCKI